MIRRGARQPKRTSKRELQLEFGGHTKIELRPGHHDQRLQQPVLLLDFSKDTFMEVPSVESSLLELQQ